MVLNSTEVLNAFCKDCKEVLSCGIKMIDLHTGCRFFLFIAIIKMMQNVVECCCECSKKETEKHSSYS